MCWKKEITSLEHSGIEKTTLCVKTKAWDRQRNPRHPQNNDSAKDLDRIQENHTIHVVTLDIHLCCHTTFNLIQNAKIMQRKVGAYINHVANETGNVWCWITVNKLITWCHKKLTSNLQFVNSPLSKSSTSRSSRSSENNDNWEKKSQLSTSAKAVGVEALAETQSAIMQSVIVGSVRDNREELTLKQPEDKGAGLGQCPGSSWA